MRAIAIVLLLALAGCSEPVQEDAPAAPRTSTGEVRDGDAVGELAYAMASTNVSAYAFQVPTEAIQDAFQGTVARGVLAWSYREAPEQAAVIVFDEDGGVVWLHTHAPTTGTRYGLVDTGTPIDEGIDLDDVSFRWPSITEGQMLHAVVAVKGGSDASAYLIFGGSRDIDERALEAVPLNATGHGKNWSFGSYDEFHGGIFGVGLSGSVRMQGDAVLDERSPAWLPPQGGVRDATVTVRGLDAGWSIAVADHAAGLGASAWDMAIEAGGGAVAASGVSSWTPLDAGSTANGIWGYPAMLSIGDGGPARAEATVQGAVTVDHYVLRLLAFSLDSSLADLTGIDVAPMTWSRDGDVPP